MGGRSSQRKGRAGEHEVRDIAIAAGLDARTHGIYEPLDVSINDEPFEVKRRAAIFKAAYDALHAGARGIIFRSDREQWLIATPFKEWLERERELISLGDALLEERERE